MPITKVRAHERVREGRREHVRQHTREVRGSSGVQVQELPPEDGEMLEEINEQKEEQETQTDKRKAENKNSSAATASNESMYKATKYKKEEDKE